MFRLATIVKINGSDTVLIHRLIFVLATFLCFVPLVSAQQAMNQLGPEFHRKVILNLLDELESYPVKIHNDAPEDRMGIFHESRALYADILEKMNTQEEGVLTPVEYMRWLVKARLGMTECYSASNQFEAGIEYSRVTIDMVEDTPLELEALRGYIQIIRDMRAHLFGWGTKRSSGVALYNTESAYQLMVDAYQQLTKHPLHTVHPDPLYSKNDLYDYAYFAEAVKKEEPALAIEMFENFFTKAHKSSRVNEVWALPQYMEPYQQLLSETGKTPHADFNQWSQTVRQAESDSRTIKAPSFNLRDVTDFYESYLDVWNDNLRRLYLQQQAQNAN
jgi:hypothetical protein